MTPITSSGSLLRNSQLRCVRSSECPRPSVPGLFGTAIYSASETGILTYWLFEPYLYQFVWMDRHGRSLGEVSGARSFSSFDLSRDAKRLVVSRANLDRVNLWTIDLSRNVESQLTFGPALEFDPRWGPDGRRVAATTWGENGNKQVIEFGIDRTTSVGTGERLPR